MHERSETVFLRPQIGDDLLHDFAIGKLDVGTRGVDDELLRQAARKLVLVLEQDLLVVLNILERLAFRSLAALLDVGAAIGGPSSGIRKIYGSFLGPGADAVKLAPVSNRIEVLQRESRW